MFHNKNVVITGAGRGIGRALALGFAQQGATVLVHYSSLPDLTSCLIYHRAGPARQRWGCHALMECFT